MNLRAGRTVVNAHVIAVIENEWAQMIRNRVIILTTFGPPFLFVALAITVLVLSSLIQISTESLGQLQSTLARQIDTSMAGLNEIDALRAALLNPFLVLFEVLPVIVPLTVASYSIIGEKQTRSLEALLATPIRTWELLVAKSFAAAMPGIIATWCSYAVFVAVAWFTVSPVIYRNVILSPAWLTSILLLTPVLTMFAVSLGIIISSKVKDPQSAQQLGSLVVLPMVGIMVGQVVGAVHIDINLVLGTALALGVVDVVLLVLAVKLFQRESILTRWK